MIAGYIARPWRSRLVATGEILSGVVPAGSQFDAGPQPVCGPGVNREQCRLCGGPGHWWFRDHLACIQRHRALGVPWAWVSGEREVWPGRRREGREE